MPSMILGERNGLLSMEEICMVELHSPSFHCSPHQEQWDPYQQTQMCKWKELLELTKYNEVGPVRWGYFSQGQATSCLRPVPESNTFL